MKIFIPVLILMSLLITEVVAQIPAPLEFTAVPGDRKITMSWKAPNDTVTGYYVVFSPGETLPNQPHERFVSGTSHTLTLRENSTMTVSVRARGDGVLADPITVTTQILAPTHFRATPGNGQVTLSWENPIGLRAGFDAYEYSQNGGAWTSTNSSTIRIHSVTDLENGRSYTFRVRIQRNGEVADTFSKISRTVTVTPLGPAPGSPGTLNVQRVEDTATLTWSPSRNTGEQILRYEYSEDDGSTWTSTGSTDTTYTVTGLEAGETYTFVVRAVYVDGETSRIISHRSRSSNSAVLNFPKPKRRVIQDCPVGWVRSDGFAGRNRRVLIYEVKLQMDIHNRVSIYKPDWVAIYVHPNEGLENLDGWKLQVALPYNQHREYLLTAENSVVVDAGFVEGGFAFIENPEEDPFPMVGVGFTGSPAPGFDYRLYDETGKRVDFGISCYKRFDIFQVLKEMEDPRVLRKVLLESFDWDQWFLRSEWTVPTPAPAAPSLVKKDIVGTWADLKKQ